MESKKENKLGLGILIGVLVTLVIVLTGFIIYDKVLSKDSDVDDNKQPIIENDNQDKNNNDENSTTNNTLTDFDISKFDNTKEAINGPKGIMYNIHEFDINDNNGLSISLNSNKKSATITIDWSKYFEIYGISATTGETRNYEVTNFSKNIRKVYISGFGQGSGYETAIYVMEDGTVEYTPIKHALGNNGSSSATVLKSYGKMSNIDGVVTVVTAVDYCDKCVGSGVNLLGIRTDGTFFNLSHNLYDTNYYIF